MKWICLLIASIGMAQTTPVAPVPEKVPTGAPATSAAPTTTAAPARVLSPAEMMRASIDKQKAAVATQVMASRKQAESAGATLVPWAPPVLPIVPGAECDPIAADIVDPIIEEEARRNSVDVKLVRAVMEQESGFKPCAVSVKGAQGLMQLMPDTAEELNVTDPFDPRQNVAAGTKYLKKLLDHYDGETKLAVAAYNAGTYAVDTNAGIPDIPETKQYVAAILKKLN